MLTFPVTLVLESDRTMSWQGNCMKSEDISYISKQFKFINIASGLGIYVHTNTGE